MKSNLETIASAMLCTALAMPISARAEVTAPSDGAPATQHERSPREQWQADVKFVTALQNDIATAKQNVEWIEITISRETTGAAALMVGSGLAIGVRASMERPLFRHVALASVVAGVVGTATLLMDKNARSARLVISVREAERLKIELIAAEEKLAASKILLDQVDRMEKESP